MADFITKVRSQGLPVYLETGGGKAFPCRDRMAILGDPHRIDWSAVSAQIVFCPPGIAVPEGKIRLDFYWWWDKETLPKVEPHTEESLQKPIMLAGSIYPRRGPYAPVYALRRALAEHPAIQFYPDRHADGNREAFLQLMLSHSRHVVAVGYKPYDYLVLKFVEAAALGRVLYVPESLAARGFGFNENNSILFDPENPTFPRVSVAEANRLATNARALVAERHLETHRLFLLHDTYYRYFSLVGCSSSKYLT